MDNKGLITMEVAEKNYIQNLIIFEDYWYIKYNK